MNKSYVSMEQKICKVCGNKYDTGALLMDKRLRDSMEKYTVTGMGCCGECTDHFNKGFIALVEVSNAPKYGTTLLNENAERTGTIARLRKTVFNQVFNTKVSDTQKMVFVEPEVIVYLQTLVNEQVGGMQ